MPNNNTPMDKIIGELTKRISELEEKIRRGEEADNEVTDTSNVINKLKANPYSICYDGVSMSVAGLLSKLMGTNPDYYDLVIIAKNLSVVAEAKNEGFDVLYDEKELEDFDRLVSSLEILVEKEKEERLGQKGAISAAEDSLLFAEILLDKLNKGDNGVEYITDEEIDYLMEIVAESKATEKIALLEELRMFQQKVFLENIRRLEDDVFFREEGEEQSNITRLDRDLLIQIFENNGFDYSVFSEKYMDLIEKKCNISKIQNFFNYIKNKPEFEFIRVYGSNSVSIRQREAEIRVFYGLLRYSTPEILDYLLNDSKTRNVELEDILTIDGVYKRAGKEKEPSRGGGGGSSDVTIAGTYEYYVRNKALLDSLSAKYRVLYSNPSIDFYKNAVQYGKIVMATPPDLVGLNIHLIDLYGINLIEGYSSSLVSEEQMISGSLYNVKAITTLSSRNLADRMDLLIEVGGYNYISNYPSILKEELTIKKTLFAYKNGDLAFDSLGRIKEIRRMSTPANMNSVLNRSAVEAVEDAVPDYYKNKAASANSYSTSYSNIFIDKLDDMYLKEDKMTYDIDGILVSAMKVKRIFYQIDNTLLGAKVPPVDSDLLKLYVLSHGSYYSDSEMNTLKNAIKKTKGALK